MTIRDPGSDRNIGFGVRSRQIYNRGGEDERRGIDPHASFIAKKFEGHPVAKFLAASAATMVGMHYAGKVMRGEGLKLFEKFAQAAESGTAKGWQTQLLDDFRKTRAILDNWEGITARGPDGTIIPHIGDSADGVDREALRSVMQRKLVSQARRLPYELPAAYLSQRLPGIGTDAVFGGQQEDGPNWYNPVDVVGDFAYQSVKNLAAFLIPVDAGGTVIKRGWQNILTYGDNVAAQSLHSVGVNMDSTLQRVGHNAADLLARTAQLTNKGAAGFASGIQEAISHTRSTVEYYHVTRNSATTKANQEWMKRAWGKADELFGYARPYRIGKSFTQGFNRGIEAFDTQQSHLTAWRQGRSFLPDGVTPVDRRMALKGRGANPLEDLVKVLYRESGGNIAAPDIKSMRGGEFYKSHMTAEYKKYLTDAMVKLKGKEIPREDIKRFLDLMEVGRIPTARNMGSVEQRLRFAGVGGMDEADFVANLGEATKNLRHGEALHSSLGSAVSRADREMLKNLDTIEGRIFASYRATYNDILVPFAAKKLGQTKLPFEQFRDLTDHKTYEYLVRNTADQVNKLAHQQGKALNPIRLEGAKGTFTEGMLRPIDEIAGDITQYGFGGDRTQMRNFLIQQGTIARPGKNGFNIFGLRRLSAERAHQQRYFPQYNKQISTLLEDVANNDRLGTYSKFRSSNFGAVFETSKGQIMDLTPFASAGRRLFDMFNEQFQIPLLHFNPLQVAGGGLFQQFARTPIVQIGTKAQYHPFLSAEAQAADTLVFTRDKWAKGTLSFLQQEGFRYKSRVEGTFRSAPIDKTSLAGRSLRLALGDKGQVANPRTGWRRLFNVDEDQPHSVRGFWKRFQGRKTDINNPAVFARIIRENGYDLSKLQGATIAGRRLTNTEIEHAWTNLEQFLRTKQISPSVMRSLLEESSNKDKIKAIFSTKTFDEPGSLGRTYSLTDVNDKDTLLEILHAAKSDEAFAGLNQVQESRIRQAGKHLLEKHIRGDRTPYYFEQPSSQTMQKIGIHRRLDEAKADLGRFLSIRAAVESDVTGTGGFQNVAGDLLGGLEDLKRRSLISQSEYVEARAAVFSLQINYDSIAQFQRQATGQANRINAMRSSMKVTHAQKALQSIENYDLETGALRSVKSVFKKGFGVGGYEYPGVEYNPFAGGQESTFLPTFSTVRERVGTGRALKSALGLTNWSDPEAFSALSIASSHGFQRLNSFMDLFGLRLDETAYRGSLDFYGRGLVGQRVLPLVAGGAAFMTVDRTLGGLVHDRDQSGERNYSPLFLGAAASGVKEVDVGLAGLIPGGMSAEEKRYQLEQGEVAVRHGRWWPIGNTPFRGGRVDYYRPSWYRRFKSGHLYSDQTYGSPLERAAFGYDFSPLRPLDPYHYERKHENDRPYPVTGEYFQGPWGPITPLLNATVGKVLKPRRYMHKDEVDFKLANAYQTVGEAGVAPLQTQGGEQLSIDAARYGGTLAVGPGTGGRGAIGVGGSRTGHYANRAAQGAIQSQGTAQTVAKGGVGASAGISAKTTLSELNKAYETAAASYPANHQYAIDTAQGAFTPSVITAGKPLNPQSLRYQAGELGYKTQEMLGIYGFAFGAVRQGLGLGDQDLSPKRPVLESAGRMTSMTRDFWDQAFGGMGDVPSPFEGEYANIELSEFARRFIPKERSGVNSLNPITNDLARLYPWLPGSEYSTNFQEGDPFAKIAMGEARLPGPGYEKLHRLHSDNTGKYGVLDRYKILADVAPYSDQYKAMDAQVDDYVHNPAQRAMVRQIRAQVAEKTKRHDFHEYEYLGRDVAHTEATITKMVSPGVYETDQGKTVRLAGVEPNMDDRPDAWDVFGSIEGKRVGLTYDKNRPPLRGEAMDVVVNDGKNFNRHLIANGYGFRQEEGKGLLDYGLETGPQKLFEYLGHENTYFNNKFMPYRSAVEDWERNNIYGSSFPQWNHPIKDFLEPMLYKATGRNPITSAFAMGAVGRLFARTHAGKTVGTLLGATVGFSAGLVRGGKEELTGQRFIPKRRKQEMAIEEYVDILSYVKNKRLQTEATMYGDMEAASRFAKQAGQTMYGADLNGRPEDLQYAIPKRKRDHFLQMIRAPKDQRDRVLSTAPRLERRIYEAAWGMNVEERPDLTNYFQSRELPGPSWEGWADGVDMENIKIKIAQNQGLDVSQMGYYPQQVEAANAINPSYPDIRTGAGSRRNVEAQLKELLYRNGISGRVSAVHSPYAGNRVQMRAGVSG